MDVCADLDGGSRRWGRWYRWAGALALAGLVLLGLALSAGAWWRFPAAPATNASVLARGCSLGWLGQFALLAALLGFWRLGLLARGTRRGLSASVTAALAARHRATLGLVLLGVEGMIVGEWCWRNAL